MNLQSLDPRMNRLHIPETWETGYQQKELDQLETFEVFQQKKENTAFTYVGPVHAPDLEVAFLFAKEQYSRRATCFGLWVVKTRDILVTPYVNDNENIFQFFTFNQDIKVEDSLHPFEIFGLKKRGKPHTYISTIPAATAEEALLSAAKTAGEQYNYVNIWVIPADKILKSGAEDVAIWETTLDKKYREPVDYKVQDKINAFKLEKGAAL